MNPHILLVDDDRATLFALSELIQRRLGNVAIDTATSAESALILLRSTMPNIIVSDVVMPGDGGMTFLAEVQRLFPDVPVILMTALGSEREQAALYGGAYAYLEKPLHVNRFIAVVRAALERAAACVNAGTQAC